MTHVLLLHICIGFEELTHDFIPYDFVKCPTFFLSLQPNLFFVNDKKYCLDHSIDEFSLTNYESHRSLMTSPSNIRRYTAFYYSPKNTYKFLVTPTAVIYFRCYKKKKHNSPGGSSIHWRSSNPETLSRTLSQNWIFLIRIMQE